MKAAFSSGWVKTVIGLSIASCVLSLIVFILFCVYAFGNPDKDAWVALDGEGNYKLGADEAAAGTGSTHIHKVFVSWFTWFVMNSLAPLVIAPLSMLFFKCSPGFGAICQICMCCAMCCSQLSWYIAGIVWRFNGKGRYSVGGLKPTGTSDEDWAKTVTAEDSLFQRKSGLFMAIFYYITVIVFAIKVTAAIVFCCCLGKGGDEEDKNCADPTNASQSDANNNKNDDQAV